MGGCIHDKVAFISVSQNFEVIMNLSVYAINFETAWNSFQNLNFGVSFLFMNIDIFKYCSISTTDSLI